MHHLKDNTIKAGTIAHTLTINHCQSQNKIYDGFDHFFSNGVQKLEKSYLIDNGSSITKGNGLRNEIRSDGASLAHAIGKTSVFNKTFASPMPYQLSPPVRMLVIMSQQRSC